MEVLADAATVEVPRSELPDVYPSLWLPAEVYHRQSFFVRLFVPAETPGEPRGALLARVAAALGSGTLTARCFATTADLALQQRVAPTDLCVSVKGCARCQTDTILQVTSTKETVGPYRVIPVSGSSNGSSGGSGGNAGASSTTTDGIPNELYVFVFNQCRSLCSSSRLHLRCNLVLGLALGDQPCFAHSNVFAVLSKIVKKSRKRPPPPTLASALPPAVRRALVAPRPVPPLPPPSPPLQAPPLAAPLSPLSSPLLPPLPLLSAASSVASVSAASVALPQPLQQQQQPETQLPRLPPLSEAVSLARAAPLSPPSSSPSPPSSLSPSQSLPPPPLLLHRTLPPLAGTAKSPPMPHDQLSSTCLLPNVLSLLQQKYS